MSLCTELEVEQKQAVVRVRPVMGSQRGRWRAALPVGAAAAMLLQQGAGTLGFP